MKALRYVLFIPIVFLLINLVYNLLPLSLFTLTNLSKFWTIILLLFFGGAVVGGFQLMPGVIAWLVSKISPNKYFAFYSIALISVLSGAAVIIDYWILSDIYQGGFNILLGVILTCLTIGFGISFIVGAGLDLYEEKESLLSILIGLGTIIFYTGIFLTFCLLTVNISYINPEKTYTWLSGIWHGIFVIPHWIASWFADDIYCKAPNSTTAYSVWWWITFIFVGLGIFAGSGNRRERF